jgi:hypothetical protein
MLQKAANELVGLKRHRLPRCVAAALVAEDHLAVIDGKDAAVGDGHTMDVASEVLKYTVGSLDRGLDVDDPVLVPDRLW